ncbi:MAG: hypothetical protein AAF557_00215 [Pseudomonadota bacterium]
MNEKRWDVPGLRIEVPLTEEELAAVVGWQKANDLASRETAVRQLVRLGLLSEIGRVFRESAVVEESD